MPETIYILNDDPQNFSIKYVDNGNPEKRAELESRWQHFNRTDPATGQSYKIYVRSTNPVKEVVVDYNLPEQARSGRYRVDVFVPGIHATSQKASFSVFHTQLSNENVPNHEESLVLMDMADFHDVWRPLGIYHFDQNLHPNVGRVRQYDFSQEDPPREMSFGPVRFVPLADLVNGRLKYDPPVGSEHQRQNGFPARGYMFGKYPIWVAEWFDYTPYLEWYIYGFHTGADLNLPGSSGADKGQPIYSVSEGIVTYAGKAGSWGSIIVIEHPEAMVNSPDGHFERQKVYSRYGHVDENILVSSGDIVVRGQNIGFIGLARGTSSGWHLHFDVSHSDLLSTRPGHWPDMTLIKKIRSAEYVGSRRYEIAKQALLRDVMQHYIDPFQFLQDNHGRY